jgi:hypothetical protein
LLLRNSFDAIIHFAGSIVDRNSVRDPLGYYLNNTCESRAGALGPSIPTLRLFAAPNRR